MDKKPLTIVNMPENMIFHVYVNIPDVGTMVRFKYQNHCLDLHITAQGLYNGTLHFRLTNPFCRNWVQAGEMNKTDLSYKIVSEFNKLLNAPNN